MMKAALIQLHVSSGEIPEKRWMHVEQLLSELEGQKQVSRKKLSGSK